MASSFTFFTEKKKLREKEGREPLSLWKLTRGDGKGGPIIGGFYFILF
jgi:hypothetical protein